MIEDVKAAAASWARVAGAALVAWATSKMVDDQLDVFALTEADGRAAIGVVVGASVLTAANWLRGGDTRFGNR